MAIKRIASEVLQRQDKDGMLRRALERIIQLYTDKSHFVYELLQYAEDNLKLKQFRRENFNEQQNDIPKLSRCYIVEDQYCRQKPEQKQQTAENHN